MIVDISAGGSVRWLAVLDSSAHLNVFADAGALGFHLSETAGPHFPSLLEVATPGAFLFFGDVPTEMQQATKAMGLAAEFAPHRVGFNR